MTEGELFIDASLFLGMHSAHEATRAACKTFFVEHLRGSVVMSLEHVGLCDDIIWRNPRAIQDLYYPFMDNLHTDMRIERRAYKQADLRVAARTRSLRGLALCDRLLLAMVMNRGGTLCSVNRALLRRPGLPVRPPEATTEAVFPDRLERLYQQSMCLRISRECSRRNVQCIME
ncbi:DUF6190 family protein [Sorangium sp. So ce1128]